MAIVRMATLWAALGAGGLLLAGCQANGSHAAAGPASTQAVACDKCKVTYVKVPIRGGKSRIVSYRTEKRMDCPECRSAAENFFATGKFEHSCAICGDAVEICKAH